MTKREVVITDEAQMQLIAIPSKDDYAKVKNMLSVLGVIYAAGSLYDPAYKASRPPVDCRVVYAGHYGIYYMCEDKDASPVVVFSIVDQRRNPLTRFSETSSH